MKHILPLIFFFLLFTGSVSPVAAQQAALPDSLEGFDEAAVMKQIKDLGIPLSDVDGYIRYQKAKYAGQRNGTWQKVIHDHDHDAKMAMTPCTNMDFETNTLTGWSGFTGYHPTSSISPPCCSAPGFVAGRFDIVTGAGTDPYGLFPIVAPGGNYSLRLGNSNVGAEAERVEQTFTVSPANTSFTYHYAVVLQDVGHPPADQPYFNIEMRDASGNLIPCSAYSVSAAQNVPGFLVSPTDASVTYKPWTTVSIDLSNYVGQNVTIRFTTADCAYSGHFGYAYIDCSCIPNTVVQSATLCTGDQIILSAPPGSASYQWSPNGETTDSIYVSQPGMYCVNMTSVTGCQQILCVNVTQFPKPTANFSINSPNCSLSATFADSSSSTAATWTWDFGDNTTSATQNPQHTYAQGGLYYVQLIVTTADGCSDTAVKPLSPGGMPIANFTDSLVCLSGTFNDSTIVTQGNVTGWQWNFGDPTTAGNNTSVFQNPSHNFSLPGVYNVMLISTSSNGCTDTVVKAVTVSTQLNANFSNTSACEGSTTVFNDLSTSSVGTVAVWNWNFGDNTNSALQDPTHQYTTTGSYQVTLTASTNTGCVGAVTKTVTVNPMPQPAYTATNVCLNSVSVFTNQSNIATGNISNYSWDFDDNATSVQQSPQHTYASPGVYNVTLVLTSDSGCVDSITQAVTVHANPAAAFVADDVDGCAPHCVNFSDSSTVAPGLVTAWNWDFGDGGDTLVQNPRHCYTTPGTYSVTLTATTNNGCTNTITLNNYITAYPSPTAGFTASPNPTTVLEPLVQFTDLSAGASQWEWIFGDGDTTVLNVLDHPAHVYPDFQAGTYTVWQIVTSANGCRDSVSVEIIIEGDFSFYIPNAFTPNGDGKNEYFFGTGDGIKEYEMYVFDRWGNKIFYADNMNLLWDGKVNGRMVQEDTYVYRVNLTDIFNKKHTYIGHVSVIR